MTTKQIVITTFAVLFCGFLLPLSSGQRWGLAIVIMLLAVLIFAGGGAEYLAGLAQQ